MQKRIVININTNNDAFIKNESNEICRILENVITRIKDSNIEGLQIHLSDRNGNTVGWFNHYPET